jgi:hypothetical protein
MNIAHLYIRVSSLDQVDGHSLSIQEESGWRWFDQNLAPHGIKRGLVFRDEGESAYTGQLFKRENGRKLADNTIVSRGDHIIFLRFDRSFRNMRDYCNTMPNFENRGIKCHFVNCPVNLNSGVGRAMAYTLVMAAELESTIKSERMREVFEYHRQHLAHIPFGKNFLAIPGLKVRKSGDQSIFVKDPQEFEAYLYFLRQASTNKFAMHRLADMTDEFYHSLKGIEYKRSAFSPRLWPDNRASARRYAHQSFHQNSLKHFYNDRPEFHLPIAPRFAKMVKEYEDKVLSRRQNLPGNGLSLV